MEREAAKAESLQKQLSYTAFTPTVNISVRWQLFEIIKKI
jgi:hypothetical protein